jgi:putative DNA primase/helicase
VEATSAINGEVNGHAPTLFPSHRADLERRGLTAATLSAAGIRSEHDRRKLASMLNRKSWSQQLGSAIVIPYHDSEGAVVLNRVKPDRPQQRNGKSAKYLTPTGATTRVYFPPGAHKRIADGATEIIISEGEWKALAGMQSGIVSISLSGVDSWHRKNSTTLLPDLEFPWVGVTAYIAFDSDAESNARVQQNELLLATQLKQRGAKVRIVRLPAGPNGEKVGLDDFLVANGATALRKLMDTAEEPGELPPEIQKAEAFEADPADIAQKFLDSISIDGQPRLHFYRSEWQYWERGSYRELPNDDLAAKTAEFYRRDFYNVKREHVANVLMHLKSLSLVGAHIEAPTWLSRKADDWPSLECISTKSGIVHLPSYAEQAECLKAPTPRFFTTAGVDYPFDHEAPQPVEWLKFLQSLWEDDWQSICTLCEFFGYCLTPDTSQQKLLMIVGPKRSGKGTILRILRALVGKANVAAPTLSSLCERFGLWPLLGKPVAIISDARLSGRADQAVIVERILSVTGEDAQTVDRKNLQPVTVKLPTRFVIVTNELPRLGDASGALVSRMLLLRTVNSFFGAEDHSLTDRLLAELPGIFLWAVAGWQSLRERGRFVQPDSSMELLGELNDLSSPIGAFVRDRCDVGSECAILVDALYDAWKNWCEASGKMHVTDKATFGRDLSALLPGVRKTRPRAEDGGRAHVYTGIELKF